jgi:hypothetical protein
MKTTLSVAAGVVLATSAALFPGAAAAGYPEVDLGAGFTGAASGRSAWLAGADTRLGVNVEVGWCRLGEVLVAERLGLDLHIQVMAARLENRRTGVEVLLGLAPWAAATGGPGHAVTRLPTPIGVLIPEFGLALGAEHSGRPYFAWSVPLRIKATEFAPALIWLSPGPGARILLAVSLRVHAS